MNFKEVVGVKEFRWTAGVAAVVVAFCLSLIAGGSLAAGRVVSITAVPSAERRLTLPFLGGRIRLAEGAPWLSLATSAPILPAWALAGPDGVIEATIGPPFVTSVLSILRL